MKQTSPSIIIIICTLHCRISKAPNSPHLKIKQAASELCNIRERTQNKSIQRHCYASSLSLILFACCVIPINCYNNLQRHFIYNCLINERTTFVGGAAQICSWAPVEVVVSPLALLLASAPQVETWASSREGFAFGSATALAIVVLSSLGQRAWLWTGHEPQ